MIRMLVKTMKGSRVTFEIHEISKIIIDPDLRDFDIVIGDRYHNLRYFLLSRIKDTDSCSIRMTFCAELADMISCRNISSDDFEDLIVRLNVLFSS